MHKWQTCRLTEAKAWDQVYWTMMGEDWKPRISVYLWCTVEPGGRVIVYSWIREGGLADLSRSSLCGKQSSDCKYLERRDFGDIFRIHCQHSHLDNKEGFASPPIFTEGSKQCHSYGTETLESLTFLYPVILDVAVSLSTVDIHSGCHSLRAFSVAHSYPTVAGKKLIIDSAPLQLHTYYFSMVNHVTTLIKKQKWISQTALKSNLLCVEFEKSQYKTLAVFMN